MRSSRKPAAPKCCRTWDEDTGSLTVHHQWHARNVHGFVIKWYVCEWCGLTMHHLPGVSQAEPVYEYIPPYIIEEMPAA